jgi:hypothetical protein
MEMGNGIAKSCTIIGLHNKSLYWVFCWMKV